MELGGVSTHGYYEFRLHDELDTAALTRALCATVKRHDMLRSIMLPDGRLQVLDNVPEIRIEELEVPPLEARRLRSQRTFDVHSWPMFAVAISRDTEGARWLHFDYDQILMDGRSQHLFFVEWHAHMSDDTPPVAPPAISFRQCAIEMARASVTAMAAEGWDERLAIIGEAPHLPYAKPLGSIEQPVFSRIQRMLQKDALANLRAVACHNRVTISSLLVSTYATVSATHTCGSTAEMASTFHAPQLPTPWATRATLPSRGSQVRGARTGVAPVLQPARDVCAQHPSLQQAGQHTRIQ